MGPVAVPVLGGHAQALGGGVHPLDKGRLSARDVLGHGHAAGGGRRDQDQPEQGIHRQAAAVGQGHGGGIAGLVAGDLGGEIADGHQSVQGQITGLQLLEDDVGGHHLGHGGGDAHGVRVLLIQGLAGVVVDDDGAVGGHNGLGGLGRGGGRGQQARQECQGQQQGGEARGVLHTGQLLLSKNISLYYATSALPCQFFTGPSGFSKNFLSFSPLPVTDAAAGAYS